MKSSQILIIGGVTAGAKTEARAHRQNGNITTCDGCRHTAVAACLNCQFKANDLHEPMSMPAGAIRSTCLVTFVGGA